jgi:hypothetical protein
MQAGTGHRLLSVGCQNSVFRLHELTFQPLDSESYASEWPAERLASVERAVNPLHGLTSREIGEGQEIELLPLLDQRLSVNAKAESLSDAWAITSPTAHSYVAIPVQPRGGYELAASFTRPLGSTIAAVLLLPCGAGKCGLELGHPNKNDATAVNRIGEQLGKNLRCIIVSHSSSPANVITLSLASSRKAIE